MVSFILLKFFQEIKGLGPEKPGEPRRDGPERRDPKAGLIRHHFPHSINPPIRIKLAPAIFFNMPSGSQ